MTTTRTRTIADLPGPPGFPALGHLPALGRGRAHQALGRWCDQYGPTFRIRLRRRSAVVTADPVLVDAVLRQRPDTFRRATRVTDILDELGIHGVFNAEGRQWQRLRRAATRSLNAAYLNTYFTTVARTTERLQRRWEAAADSGTRVDVLADMMRYSLDVTTGLALGHDLNAVENDGDGLHRRLPELFPEISRRINAPLPYWRRLRLPRHRRLAATMADLDALVGERFEQAQRAMATGAAPSNFLEALVEPLEDEPPLTHQELLGNVLTMLLAGEDTTSATAAWAIHHLAAHPEVHQQVRAEADEVLGVARFPADMGALRRLRYAEAVVNESARLHPVAPHLVMQPLHDVVLQGRGGLLELPRDTPIFVLLTRGGREDTVRFPEPGRFRPERWLDGPAAASPSAPVYLPFGGGPRFCPGRNLALVEATMVTAVVARDFDLAPETSAGPVTERSAFSVFPRNIAVTLTRRGS